MRAKGAKALVSWGAPSRAGLRWDGPALWQGAAATLGGWWRQECERRRLFNWLPVAMGLGVLLYFSADNEPGFVPPLIGLVVSGAGALAAKTRPVARGAAVAAAFVFLGFACGVLRTARMVAPALDRPRVGVVSGHVEEVEHRANGARIVIQPTAIAGLGAEELPRRIRVTLRNATSVKGADHVTATMRLLPPPGPARPGGYDFGRDAFFRGVGAVGSVSGPINLSPATEEAPLWLRFNAAIDRARNTLTERILRTIGGQAGAVAAALVTGKRGQISDQTNDDLRAAGIYHVVSISGLHMVLAAGAIFWSLRALLALVPAIALVWPIKKIAALGGMAGATAYCIFSGSEVATERSLIMTLVLMGAILVDRPALSMRNLALSALIVLAREPETLLGPSFQMSFGAVAALIAFAERAREGGKAGPKPQGWAARLGHVLWLAILGDLVTTLLATAATAPFGVFHFQNINPFGLIGNAMALPFVSLIVMPAAVAGVVLYPFGLDAVAWLAMGAATWPVLAMSAWIGTLSGATQLAPAFGLGALLLLALALLWITLWTTPLRYAALMPLALGLLLAARPERLDGFIDRGGVGAALRGEDGKLHVLGRPSSFTLAQWLTADGDRRKPQDAASNAATRCDREGCVLDLGQGRFASYARTRQAVAEDCGRAELVITPMPWRLPCAALLVDRKRLDAEGALSLRRTGEGWRITAARGEGDRPWFQRIRAPAALPPAAAPSSVAEAKRPGASPANGSEEAPPETEPATTEDLRVQ